MFVSVLGMYSWLTNRNPATQNEKVGPEVSGSVRWSDGKTVMSRDRHKERKEVAFIITYCHRLLFPTTLTAYEHGRRRLQFQLNTCSCSMLINRRCTTDHIYYLRSSHSVHLVILIFPSRCSCVFTWFHTCSVFWFVPLAPPTLYCLQVA